MKRAIECCYAQSQAVTVPPSAIKVVVRDENMSIACIETGNVRTCTYEV